MVRRGVAMTASVVLMTVMACSDDKTDSPESQRAAPAVVPIPATLDTTDAAFTLGESATITTPGDAPEVTAVAEYLATILRRSTGFPVPVDEGDPAPDGGIGMELTGDLTGEAYELEVTGSTVRLRAGTAEGLFRGVQTLRQLLPPRVESSGKQDGPWTIAGVRIADQPRFAWRGAALDVARHFFGVDEVKRYIDLIAMYKINVLHLHLSDDQGWRVEIRSWPKLTAHGGSTEVGGGEGGFYTQQDYAELVRYAQRHYITVVPEIDVPGHTNAALASYPELNCDGKPRELYTGIEVGFSSLCVDKPVTYQFLDDVIGELAALTPGEFLHLGGDEVKTLEKPDYARFVQRTEQIVRAHGKKMIGWQEMANAELNPETVVQYWDPGDDDGIVRDAVARGSKVLMSPAAATYLDMKPYDGSPLGLVWAGIVDVDDAYKWDPTGMLGGLEESSVAGVEAQLWSETLEDVKDIEFMVFPRLPATAEIGWSPADRLSWDDFRARLAQHGPRWSTMDVNFYSSDKVDWK